MSDITINLDDEIKALNFSNYIIPLHELVEYTIHALKKTASRTDKDIVVLREYVKKSPFLKAIVKKYDAFVCTELCHRLEYRFFPAGHRLITPGTVGPAVFILLQGSVQVIPQLASKAESSSSLATGKSIENATGGAYGEIDKDEYGEYLPNKAMVICHQDSHFATISRREYEKILMLFRKKKLDEQIAFLSSLSFFKGWAPHLLKPWAEAFENKEIYLRKRLIYKQGDPLKNIYVIKSGNVLCTKALPVQGGVIGGHEVGIDDQNQVFLVDNETLCRSVEVAKLGPGQVLGDIEALEAYILAREKDGPVQDTKKDQDAEALQAKKRIELVTAECANMRRQTTMTVESLDAEIWSIPIAQFFANLEPCEAEFRTIAELIGDKKRRRDTRVTNVLQNSKEYTSFLKTQKTATLKKDLVSTIKTRKFNRSTADTLLGNNSPVNETSYLETGSPQHDTSPYNFTAADNDYRRATSPTQNNNGSRSRSPKREEAGNQSFYEALNRQESLRSSITGAWSPIRGSKERSPKNQKREKLLDSPKYNEKIEESCEEEVLLDLHRSIDEGETKMTPVAEIRTSQQIPIFNSRTSYIGYTIEKKRHVHDKFVQNGVYSRPGTTYVKPKTESKTAKRSLSKADTSVNHNDTTVDRSQGPLKWRLMVANSDAKKRADFLATLAKNLAKKQEDGKIAEEKGPDGKNMITATYRKLSRDVMNNSGTGGDTPVLKPETANKPPPAFPNIPKVGKVNQSFSRFDRNRSRDECYSPFLELNASLRHNDSLLFEDENKHVGSDIYLISSESEEPPVYPKGSLQYMITTMGRKASKDEVKEEQEKKKCYLSTLFPGFRPKSMIKKEMDLGELYRLSLKAEAEARAGKIASRQKRRSKNANKSMDQASKEKIKKEGMMIQDVIMNKRIQRQTVKQGKQGA